MSNIKNHVHLLGRVGQDPEIKVLESGKKMARFSLATNEYYLNALGERVERTQWHTLIFWSKTVDTIEQYVRKGSQLAVTGSLATRSWEDENGTRHYRTEIVGKELQLLAQPG